jgi:hypothetical protein
MGVENGQGFLPVADIEEALPVGTKNWLPVKILNKSGGGTPDNTTEGSVPLKSSGEFVDSSLKNYIPQGETDPILDSSAAWYQGSVDDTKDTPIFVYRGNGVAPPGDDIFDYFNKAGDSYGIYVDENGINVRKNSGAITPLADSIKWIPIGEFSTSETQEPTGRGDSEKIRVSFGAGGSTSGGELTLASNGTITCNTDNIQYLVEIIVRVGRTGSFGISVLHGRLMYASDGVEANAVQLGSTTTTELDNGATIWRERFELMLEPASGSKLWIEFARDESGGNSGAILTQQPTATLAGWNESSSAIITFYRVGIS